MLGLAPKMGKKEKAQDSSKKNKRNKGREKKNKNRVDTIKQ